MIIRKMHIISRKDKISITPYKRSETQCGELKIANKTTPKRVEQSKGINPISYADRCFGVVVLLVHLPCTTYRVIKPAWGRQVQRLRR
jgi:hypothetical protein